MSAASCEQVELFFDCALPAPAVEGFRVHLVTCGRCQQRLEELLQLDALFARAMRRQKEAPAREQSLTSPAGPRRVEVLVLALLLVAAAALVCAGGLL